MRVITFGTFDLFHIGHLRILERAAALGSELVVGVSSDELNFGTKGHYPVYDEDERMAIVSAIRHASRTEERSLGKECVSTCSSRRSVKRYKKNKIKRNKHNLTM